MAPTVYCVVLVYVSTYLLKKMWMKEHILLF